MGELTSQPLNDGCVYPTQSLFLTASTNASLNPYSIRYNSRIVSLPRPPMSSAGLSFIPPAQRLNLINAITTTRIPSLRQLSSWHLHIYVVERRSRKGGKRLIRDQLSLRFASWTWPYLTASGLNAIESKGLLLLYGISWLAHSWKFLILPVTSGCISE